MSSGPNSAIDPVLASLADAIAMSRRMAAPYIKQVPVMVPIPQTTSGQGWRELIDRLNQIDPEGGWGRMLWNGIEFVVVKGSFDLPGATYP